MTIKITMTREEAQDFLLCSKAVMEYWDSAEDDEAFVKYLSAVNYEETEKQLLNLFSYLSAGEQNWIEESFSVRIGPELRSLLYVMYRFVFDREYYLMPGVGENVPLEIMGQAFYTMFWPLARKVSQADRDVVRVVY
jgi:hypothetical protein